MKISKSRLKQIIKEEMSLHEKRHTGLDWAQEEETLEQSEKELLEPGVPELSVKGISEADAVLSRTLEITNELESEILRPSKQVDRQRRRMKEMISELNTLLAKLSGSAFAMEEEKKSKKEKDA
tara:strand:- start:84 stop:455 length:372 start_codon:yes stop_codon:yes gene_type:complete